MENQVGAAWQFTAIFRSCQMGRIISGNCPVRRTWNKQSHTRRLLDAWTHVRSQRFTPRARISISEILIKSTDEKKSPRILTNMWIKNISNCDAVDIEIVPPLKKPATSAAFRCARLTKLDRLGTRFSSPPIRQFSGLPVSGSSAEQQRIPERNTCPPAVKLIYKRVTSRGTR